MWREILTIQSGVHTAQIDQQTDHCHILRRLMFTQQLISQNLARLATSSHRIDIQVRKGLLANGIRLITIGEDGIVILEYEL